jgi:5'-phosphate synthase pdxT subunit
MIRIGVLGLQGDVREHLGMIAVCGAQGVEVRAPAALEDVDGLIIPGGESTAIGRLLRRTGLDRAIKDRAGDGLPVYGTCAGMILMAKEAAGGEPLILGLMDIGVARNAYGRQRESFLAMLAAPGIDADPFRVAFIRAPLVTRVGQAVQVLAALGNAPVLLQEGRLLASCFHPEITGYHGIHRYFSRIVRTANKE